LVPSERITYDFGRTGLGFEQFVSVMY